MAEATKRLLFQWRDLVSSKFGPSSPITRLVLLVISLYMDMDGGSCFPSIRLIAERTGLSVQAVVTHIKKAVDEGFLQVSVRGFTGQGWRRHEYKATFPPEGVQPDALPMDVSSVEGVQRRLAPYAEGVQRGIGKVFNDVELISSKSTPIKDNSSERGASTSHPPVVKSPVRNVAKKKSKAKGGHKRALPADFVLTPSLRAFAVAKGFSGDVDELFEACCDYWRGIGKNHADWSAVFRNWVRMELKIQKEKNNGGRPYGGKGRKGQGANSGPLAESGKYAGFSKELPVDG